MIRSPAPPHLSSAHRAGSRVAAGLTPSLASGLGARSPRSRSRPDRQVRRLCGRPPPRARRAPGARLPAGRRLSAAHWPGSRRPGRGPPRDARLRAAAPRPSRGGLHPAPGRARSGAGSGRRAGNPGGSAAARPWCTRRAAAPPALTLGAAGRVRGRRPGGAATPANRCAARALAPPPRTAQVSASPRARTSGRLAAPAGRGGPGRSPRLPCSEPGGGPGVSSALRLPPGSPAAGRPPAAGGRPRVDRREAFPPGAGRCPRDLSSPWSPGGVGFALQPLAPSPSLRLCLLPASRVSPWGTGSKFFPNPS